MTDLDLRADATLDFEAPKRLELIDPITEEPIIDEAGKPAYLMLYSAQSDTFQRRAFKLKGRWAAKAKRAQKGQLSFEEEKAAEAEIYAATFADEWHIVRKDGGKWKALDVPCTPENAVKWCLANPLYRPQIVKLTDDIESYLGVGAENFTNEASAASSKASKAR